MRNSKVVRTVVVDDHVFMRELIGARLCREHSRFKVLAEVGDAAAAVAACTAAGLRVLAADASGETDLDHLDRPAAPTAWLFGSEAHGLPDDLASRADARVRVPIHGRA